MLSDIAFPEKSTAETVLSVTHWTDNLFTFRISRPASYQFAPGQFSRLGLFDGKEWLWRAYSVVSGAQETYLDYLMILVPDGQFSGMMATLQPGAQIALDKTAFGFMTASRFSDGNDLWMLSTGTGIGPFISILQDDTVWKKFDRLIVVHGTRYHAEAVYHDFFRTVQDTGARRGRLSIVRASTREATIPSGQLHGRLPALFASGELARAAQCDIAPARSRFLICGNPDMISAMRTQLHEHGMSPCRRASPGHFVTEDYW